MKQVVQNYKTGKLTIEDVSRPLLTSKTIIVQTKASLISAGTERTKVETARMNLLEKAISRLDLVKTVVNNIKQEGLLFTFSKAFNKLNSPISLGYSCSGEVLESGVGDFKSGDRVACVGENYAAHCELNLVPNDSAVIIPDNVSYDQASFVGLGAIALNSVKLTQIRSEETVAVIGLGLIGQIVVQILKSKGCKVLGVEIDEDKLSLATRFGLNSRANPVKDDVSTTAKDFSSGLGVDAVIITAASSNNLPIDLAGKISRNKGRVILVGTMPIILPRKDYYEKELFFMISCGFGSGIYYPQERGRVYPYNHEPYSVAENMREFLTMIADKKIDPDPLITHKFSLDEAEAAYKLIQSRKEKYLGIVFNYTNQLIKDKEVLFSSENETNKDTVGIGFIGAGGFAQSYILPVLKRSKKVNLIGVATARGISAKSTAEKFGFNYCLTDYLKILNDKNINCVFIMTRHDLHAKLVIESLQAGKNVFVEKPLALSESELYDIRQAYLANNLSGGVKPLLMVGFNRRFSPFIKKVKDFFANNVSPLMINYRINAGNLPLGHWARASEGGGMILGEVCHFVDLLIYLTNSQPIEASVIPVGNPDRSAPIEDNVSITIKFKNGSVGVINYNSIGDVSFPRERIEIFGANSVAVIDNFNKLMLSRSGHEQKFRLFSRDMGHKNEIESFAACLAGRKPLVAINDLFLATLTTLKIKQSLSSVRPVKIEANDFFIKENE